MSSHSLSNGPGNKQHRVTASRMAQKKRTGHQLQRGSRCSSILVTTWLTSSVLDSWSVKRHSQKACQNMSIQLLNTQTIPAFKLLFAWGQTWMCQVTLKVVGAWISYRWWKESTIWNKIQDRRHSHLSLQWVRLVSLGCLSWRRTFLWNLNPFHGLWVGVYTSYLLQTHLNISCRCRWCCSTMCMGQTYEIQYGTHLLLALARHADSC